MLELPILLHDKGLDWKCPLNPNKDILRFRLNTGLHYYRPICVKLERILREIRPKLLYNAVQLGLSLNKMHEIRPLPENTRIYPAQKVFRSSHWTKTYIIQFPRISSNHLSHNWMSLSHFNVRCMCIYNMSLYCSSTCKPVV